MYLSDGRRTDETASSYISMGTLGDPKQDGKGELENIDLPHFPPEKHFCQPIAESLSKLVRDTTPLPYLPSSHYHTHDYGMIDQNSILVVVGEALSNTCVDCEHDKCLPGLGRCLSIYESGISMVSAWNRCYVSIAHIDTASDSDGTPLPFLSINTVKTTVGDYKSNYHHYINQILNVLELASIAFVSNPGNSDVRSTNHPAINPSNAVPHFDYNKKRQIDMPGVYWGYNSSFVKHEAPGLYDAYIEGWKNKGVVLDMYNHFQTNLRNLAVPAVSCGFANQQDNDDEDGIGGIGTVANVHPEIEAILGLCSPTNGAYPHTAIDISGHVKPIRNARFYEQSTPNYNPVDSYDDKECAKTRDPGELII